MEEAVAGSVDGAGASIRRWTTRLTPGQSRVLRRVWHTLGPSKMRSPRQSSHRQCYFFFLDYRGRRNDALGDRRAVRHARRRFQRVFVGLLFFDQGAWGVDPVSKRR